MLGQNNDKSANLLRIALNNSDRLVRLINDILDLERIQSGKEPLAFRPAQLDLIVRQAIDGMAPVAEAAGVQLIHDTTQVEIAADADRLLQVLTNLLSNAVKFSPPNSTISVMLRPGSSGVTLSVIDQGVVFPPTNWRPSSGDSSRWMPPTPARKAEWPGTGHLPHHRQATLRTHLGRAQSRPRFHFQGFPALPAGPH